VKFFITGENGFIAKNLTNTLEGHSHTQIKVIGTGFGASLLRVEDQLHHYDLREPCVHLNSPERWARFFIDNGVNIVIHNAALVGTDVVALKPKEAVLTNILGTHNIVRACEIAKIPICYIGTSVVYKTENYQVKIIDEHAEILPKTMYGIQKSAGDLIVKRATVPWMIIRPLFAYGGLGDMNSLIAKSLYASWTGRKSIDMFLDPAKVKDYIHVTDFCEAVILACENKHWNEDFIVAAETPRRTEEIVEIIDKHCDVNNLASSLIKWHPNTDYLGNHRLTSAKFRRVTGWLPRISLEVGIEESAQSIKHSISLHESYDPLMHLDEARQKSIDLTKFY
jgi:dTDP-glucose 4,6-dehydratase